MRCSTVWMAVPSAVYNQHVANGKLRADPRQMAALAKVDRMYNDIVSLSSVGVPPRDLVRTPTPPPGALDALQQANVSKLAQRAAAASQPVSSGSLFGGLFSGGSSSSSKSGSSSSPKPVEAPMPKKVPRSQAIDHPLSKVKGLYLHGDVGCGKTHLMDMLYHEIPSKLSRKRVHFHQFMQQVHKDMHATKKLHGAFMDGNDLMREVAIQQCDGAEVLCFDELVIADVQDAMIVRRLFDNMYKVGVLPLFTSNRPPHQLYQDGLNREAFLPFIQLLTERCVVHNMSSDTDHRLAGTVSETYLYPINDENRRRMEEKFQAKVAAEKQPIAPRTLRVYGREVVIPRAAGGVCRCSFQELCVADRSVADFSEIAKTFHTMFLENVPRFKPGNSDTKRRFIALLDELYQYRVKLHVMAQTAPKDIEQEGDADAVARPDANEESFYAGQLIGSGEDQFQMRRCVSRLEEMRSVEYAKYPHSLEPISKGV